MRHGPKPLLLSSIIFLSFMSGCFGYQEEEAQIEQKHWLPPVEERSSRTYENNDVFSRVSINGAFLIDDVRSIFIPVPDIEFSDGGAGLTGGAEVHLGLWLPVIEGCEWESA